MIMGPTPPTSPSYSSDGSRKRDAWMFAPDRHSPSYGSDGSRNSWMFAPDQLSPSCGSDGSSDGWKWRKEPSPPSSDGTDWGLADESGGHPDTSENSSWGHLENQSADFSDLSKSDKDSSAYGSEMDAELLAEIEAFTPSESEEGEGVSNLVSVNDVRNSHGSNVHLVDPGEHGQEVLEDSSLPLGNLHTYIHLFVMRMSIFR